MRVLPPAGRRVTAVFQNLATGKWKAEVIWSELVGQIAHIDHVTRFLQLQDFGKPLYLIMTRFDVLQLEMDYLRERDLHA